MQFLRQKENMTSNQTDSPKRGHEIIKDYVRSLSSQPGVYRMLDEKGAVLYIGKARNLKNRVTSYTKPTGHAARIGRMISATRTMMFITTETETEALLLEQNLIKQLKPRFNVLLRDDKSFPNIVITDHDFPLVTKHRGKKAKSNEYYGPFASAGSVNRTLNQLQKIFLLRNCSDSNFATRSRPCLQYQIHRCSAPCVGKIGSEEYAKLVNDARDFLRGRNTGIQEKLASDMQAASEAMEFERAAGLRDRIRALTHVQGTQGINPQTVQEADIIALHTEGEQACIQVFFIRAHQNRGNRAYFPRTGSGAEAGEILEGFIAQFYDNKTPPKQLILSHDVPNTDLLINALEQKREGKVEFLLPKRGEKLSLIKAAERNAREALARRM